MHNRVSLDDGLSICNFCYSWTAFSIYFCLIDFRIFWLEWFIRAFRRVDTCRLFSHVIAIGSNQALTPGLTSNCIHHFSNRVRDIVISRPSKIWQPSSYGQPSFVIWVNSHFVACYLYSRWEAAV